ncbi:MAG: hypothetical protein AAGC53_03760 [Actinomycetota bacterium]
MARYNDLDAGQQATVDMRGSLAIDLTIGRALIARRCRPETEASTADATVQARLAGARSAYQANSRAAFVSTFTQRRGTAATIYA